jgi:hypothetical protein
MNAKDIKFVKWFVDLIMGVVLLISFSTGLFKFTILMRWFGLTNVILPMAEISDIHDRSGLVLGVMVAIHLYLNRKWIIKTTRTIIFDQDIPE